jgi:hypothetical protein
MRAVWKYPLKIEDRTEVALPRGARVLTVQVVRNEVVLYAVVDPEPIRVLDRRVFLVVGTGHLHEEWLDQLAYVGTFLLHDGALVFHVFEDTK